MTLPESSSYAPEMAGMTLDAVADPAKGRLYAGQLPDWPLGRVSTLTPVSRPSVTEKEREDGREGVINLTKEHMYIKLSCMHACSICRCSVQ